MFESTLNYLLVAGLFLSVQHCAETGPCGPSPYLGSMMSGDEFVSCQSVSVSSGVGTRGDRISTREAVQDDESLQNSLKPIQFPSVPQVLVPCSSPAWGVCEGIMVMLFAHFSHVLTVRLQDA